MARRELNARECLGPILSLLLDVDLDTHSVKIEGVRGWRELNNRPPLAISELELTNAATPKHVLPNASLSRRSARAGIAERLMRVPQKNEAPANDRGLSDES
jgi:hypothetical protein